MLRLGVGNIPHRQAAVAYELLDELGVGCFFGENSGIANLGQLAS